MKGPRAPISAELIVQTKESGRIEEEMIERNVRPGVSKPAPDFAIEQRARKQGQRSRIDDREVADREEQNEEGGFDGVGHFHKI